MRRAFLVVTTFVLGACAQASGDHQGSGQVDARSDLPRIDAPPPPPPADAKVDAMPATIYDARPDAMPPDAPPPDASTGGGGVVTGHPDTCAQAIDITTAAKSAAGVAAANDTTSFADDVAPTNNCTGFLPDGPDAIYIVSLTAGQTITATATPSGWDLSLELTSTCTSAANCIAGADSSAGNLAETLTYTATLAGTYYLIVDGYNPGVAGAYTLHVKVQ